MGRARRSVVMGLLAAVGGLLPALAVSAAEIDSEAYWQEGRQKLAALGSGYVVWESNRTGRWRIWRINLDGSGLRQLSPEEPDRDHFCPHISPDGTRLTYISYPKGADHDSLAKSGQKAPLHLLSADGRFDRVIADDARSYGGDRGAVWLNPQELIYIDASLMTRRLNVTTRESKPLLAQAAKVQGWGTGWLVEPTFHYATSGQPTFSLYNAQERTVNPRAVQGGCEPYFTYDGVWGFWMGGAGGPVNRFNLATGQVSPILALHDPRMPRERSYVYFPMVSRCGRLFTFAASPDQHDHDKSDYDVFVARIDPKTLELIGKPVRYTFDKGTDRYPDVYLADLELGDPSGEAPFTVQFAAQPASGAWTWVFGDGTSSAAGPQASHTYPRPGEYRVEARQGDRVLRGRVRVAAAQPPRPLAAFPLGDRELQVTFDEPVQLQKASVRLASGARVTGWKPGADGRSLRVQLQQKLRKADRLLLAGIQDRAQKPNLLRSAALPVQPLAWPASRQGLVFLWETGGKPNALRDPGATADRTCRVTARGRATLDHNRALRLVGGSFLAEEMDARLLAACRKTNQLTLEATLRPADLRQQGPARILTFSSDPNSRNFTLGQQEDKLVFRLRTPSTGENGTNPEVEVCTLSTTEPNHIVLTYTPGLLVAYRNGREVLRTDRVQGDFRNWSDHHLLFGNEWTRDRPWQGTLEGIALYNRALTPQEVQADYQQVRALLAGRKSVPQLEVQAKLVARSRIPTLKEIQPYRNALATCEYEVEKVLRGRYAGKRVRVAQWALLDGETLPIGQAKLGSSVRLALEPFEANPQLQGTYLADTLKEDWELSPFYKVSGL